MGRIIDFIKGSETDEERVGGYENEEYDNIEEDIDEAPVKQRASSEISSSSALEMKVCKPTKYEECTEIATHLLNNKTVVLNLESVNKDTIMRIIDFLFGVTFAIEGKLKKVAASTYIITPKNVDVEDNQSAEASHPTQQKPRELF
jgi:cell division protein sepF 2